MADAGDQEQRRSGNDGRGSGASRRKRAEWREASGENGGSRACYHDQKLRLWRGNRGHSHVMLQQMTVTAGAERVIVAEMHGRCTGMARVSRMVRLGDLLR